MMNVCARQFACWASTLVVQRGRVIAKACIFHIHCAVARKCLCRATGARWHNAIEHINAAFNRAQNIQRCAHTHQVSWLVRRQQWRCCGNHIKHNLLGFAHRQAAHRIAIKSDICQLLCRFLAQVWEIRPLNNTEYAIARTVNECIAAAPCPTRHHFDVFFHTFTWRG